MKSQAGRRPPGRRTAFSVLLGALFALACQTQAQFLASRQAKALETALTRARFEMNCPDANGEVLSSEVVQPALQGPVVAGIQRAEYTIGVSGCGQRNTYVVACPEGGEGCFALDSGGLRQR
jgi:hypothetical protein